MTWITFTEDLTPTKKTTSVQTLQVEGQVLCDEFITELEDLCRKHELPMPTGIEFWAYVDSLPNLPNEIEKQLGSSSEGDSGKKILINPWSNA